MLSEILAIYTALDPNVTILVADSAVSSVEVSRVRLDGLLPISTS